MAPLEIRQLSERWCPHQVAQFGVEQGVDGAVGLGRNDFGSLEQITIQRRVFAWPTEFYSSTTCKPANRAAEH